jgi:phospholipid-translocating ATPase
MELPPRRSFQSSRPDLTGSRPDLVMGSRTDMSTGLQTSGAGRGYDFSTEEGGVAMRRIQSNLSERNRRLIATSSRKEGLAPSSGGGRHRAGSVSLFPSLRKSMQRKKTNQGVPPSPPPPPSSP